MDLLTLQPTTKAEVDAINSYAAKHARGATAVIEITDIKIHDRDWKENRGRWSNTAQRYVPKKTRLYVGAEDYKVLEDMLSGTRYDRPEQDFKSTFEAILRAMTGDEALTIRWDQHAGCTCRCSPGFIVTTTSSKLEGKDVSITYRPAVA